MFTPFPCLFLIDSRSILPQPRENYHGLFSKSFNPAVRREVGIKFRGIGVALCLRNMSDHIDKNRRIGKQRQKADDKERCGVRGGRSDRVDAGGGIHGVAVRREKSLLDSSLRDCVACGGLHRPAACVLKSGEGLGKHAPKGQCLRTVLEPRTLTECERAKCGCEKQRKAAIPCVGGQAVVGIGKVPKVIRDNPEPEHIRPKHVAALVLYSNSADTDAKPAGNGDDIEDTRDSVHIVPCAADVVLNLIVGVFDDRSGVAADFKVAQYSFADIHSKNKRRKAKSNFIFGKAFDMADAPEADAARC